MDVSENRKSLYHFGWAHHNDHAINLLLRIHMDTHDTPLHIILVGEDCTKVMSYLSSQFFFCDKNNKLAKNNCFGMVWSYINYICVYFRKEITYVESHLIDTTSA